MNRDEYHTVLEALEESVDYPNFKSMIDSVPDQKDKPYHDIWNILADKYGCYGFGGDFWGYGNSRYFGRDAYHQVRNKDFFPRPAQFKKGNNLLNQKEDDFDFLQDKPFSTSEDEEDFLIGLEDDRFQSEKKDRSPYDRSMVKSQELNKINDAQAYRLWLYRNRKT